MRKPRPVLGPGILSAALVLSSCGSPNARPPTTTTGSVGATAASAASAAASTAAIRSDAGGAPLERRSSGPPDAA